MIERAETKTRIADTKTRILDSAEKLFSERGFDATSLRDITAAAEVNLAAVNYHFQSKEILMESVIGRRIEPVNRRRVELLDQAGENASVEDILRAFLVPVVLELNLAPVAPLIGRCLADPNQFLERFFRAHFAPLSNRFAEALGRALPELPKREVLWRQHFMIGGMTHLLMWKPHLKEMTGGLCDWSDKEQLLDRMVSFFATGFRAPVSSLAAAGKDSH
jgi:AcrR family transcriptional regulator